MLFYDTLTDRKSQARSLFEVISFIETVENMQLDLFTHSLTRIRYRKLDFIRTKFISQRDGTFCGMLDRIIDKIRKELDNAYDSVLAMLQLGLLVTSFLLLFVSVLGQINIGLSSLEQRTHELLIRRAIGASRANIVTLVLGTQLIISIFVCIASILLSLLIVEGISVLLPPDSPITAPSYPIFSAVIAVITSVIVALLGGLLPAIKAAKLEPALALR